MPNAYLHNDQAQAHHALMSKPLKDIKEEELTFGLLNALFWQHDLNGHSQLKVGQVIVNKRINRFKDNAVDSPDYAVTFSWVSANGKTEEVSRCPG